MILTPWKEPIPLSRAWCVFEAYCAMDTGCKFDVAMTSADRADLNMSLKRDPKSLDKMLENIDVSKCVAFKPEDLRLIQKTIQKYEGGASKINEMLKAVIGKEFKPH